MVDMLRVAVFVFRLRLAILRYFLLLLFRRPRRTAQQIDVASRSEAAKDVPVPDAHADDLLVRPKGWAEQVGGHDCLQQLADIGPVLCLRTAEPSG